jgi:asparagine synthase (glutamine-hydrolysing)
LLDALREELYRAVTNNVPETRIGVAFSGGVDSSLLAKICTSLGKQVVLLTVGFPGSHDIDFSKKIDSMIGLHHTIIKIDELDFQLKLGHVRSMIGCGNTSHIENCLAYHYIASAARREGLGTVLSANGCDELFCGYNGYRLAFDNGPEALAKLMKEKIENENQLVDEIAVVAKEFGIVVKQPFLDPGFISFAKTIPIDRKIKGRDDMIRKHILREVALQLGVPKESALKPKKALQYGSLIHKNYRKARKGYE